MKELKIFLLVLSVGFSSPVPASPKSTGAYYPNTFKGGLQITQKQNSAMGAVMVVEGKYEYYLQYIKFKLNFEKIPVEQIDEKSNLTPACNLAIKPATICQD